MKKVILIAMCTVLVISCAPVPVSFADSRDSKAYKAVKIGEQTWMAENLNYDVEGSVCYGNCATWGRLYDWNTAMKVCPDGWHLPSDLEWTTLTDGIRNSETEAGTYLKAAKGWFYNGHSGNGTDYYSFSALPGGSGSSDGSFHDVGDKGYWWSATVIDSDRAYYRSMSYGSKYVDRDFSYKDRLFSVRCIQD